jgi:hypothetical protein
MERMAMHDPRGLFPTALDCDNPIRAPSIFIPLDSDDWATTHAVDTFENILRWQDSSEKLRPFERRGSVGFRSLSQLLDRKHRGPNRDEALLAEPRITNTLRLELLRQADDEMNVELRLLGHPVAAIDRLDTVAYQVSTE